MLPSHSLAMPVEDAADDVVLGAPKEAAAGIAFGVLHWHWPVSCLSSYLLHWLLQSSASSFFETHFPHTRLYSKSISKKMNHPLLYFIHLHGQRFESLYNAS